LPVGNHTTGGQRIDGAIVASATRSAVPAIDSKLYDDIVAEREHLPLRAERGRNLAAIVNAYGLTARGSRL
jgi:hypothetical protein